MIDHPQHYQYLSTNVPSFLAIIYDHSHITATGRISPPSLCSGLGALQGESLQGWEVFSPQKNWMVFDGKSKKKCWMTSRVPPIFLDKDIGHRIFFKGHRI